MGFVTVITGISPSNCILHYEALFSEVLNHLTDLLDKNGPLLPSLLSSSWKKKLIK